METDTAEALLTTEAVVQVQPPHEQVPAAYEYTLPVANVNGIGTLSRK